MTSAMSIPGHLRLYQKEVKGVGWVSDGQEKRKGKGRETSTVRMALRRSRHGHKKVHRQMGSEHI